jgi:hypothetical protein
MFKKIGMAAAVLAIAGIAFSAFAPAASAADPTPTPRFPSVLLRGAGVLDAQGTGVAAVKGMMDYHVTGEDGILLVKDIKGDAKIDVDGVGGTGQWHGFTAYFGIRGNAHIVGSDVAVIVVAHNIDLHVAGRGWAFLKGEGTFTANGHGPFEWTPDGAFASVTP